MSTQDAIRRAQAWLVDAKGHDFDAVDNLAALGPASVAVVVAYEKLHGVHHAGWGSACREDCRYRQVLAEWAQAAEERA